MVITRIWFFGRQSRSVDYSFKRPDFGNLGLLVGLEASRPTYWGVWGAEPPRKKGSYILHVSVEPRLLEPRNISVADPRLQDANGVHK